MKCRDVHGALERGEALGPPARDHLEACPACSALAADGGALGRLLAGAGGAATLSGGVPRPALDVEALDLDALARHVEASMAPRATDRLRTLSTRTRASLAAGLALAIIAAMALAFRRVDFAVYPGWRLAGELTVHLASALAAGWLVLRPLHLPASTAGLQGLLVGAALVLPLALGALPAAHLDHPASLAGTGDDFARRAVACFLYGAAWTAPLLLVLRKSDRLPSRGTALAAAAAAGVMANMALLLHCPLTHPAHLLAGHATVGLAFAGLALLRRR